MKEPAITVNGTQLTEAQATTLRVALTSFHASLTPDEIKALGEIGPVYKRLAEEVLTVMFSADRAAWTAPIPGWPPKQP